LLLSQHTGGTVEKDSKLADSLLEYLKSRRYGTTQETAFVVAALSEYLSGVVKAIPGAGATVTAGGKTQTVSGLDLAHAVSEGKEAAVAVANTGTAPLYISLTTRGVPEKPDLAAVSKGGLHISRAFRTSKGESFTDTVFKQTDSYIVDITLQCDMSLKNVVVEALLPAGLEVENPRLNTATIPGTELTPATSPDNLDIRDDGVIFAFDSLPSDTFHFYFVVHAVTPGKYVLPAAFAECMYDAKSTARTDSGNIEVK
jgi:hypothetical protein